MCSRSALVRMRKHRRVGAYTAVFRFFVRTKRRAVRACVSFETFTASPRRLETARAELFIVQLKEARSSCAVN